MTPRRILRLAAAGASLVFVVAGSTPARADYPIMSHRYLADPGSLVHDGRIYLYNSNDDDNAEAGGYTMHSIVCVSSSDLKNWTDHGIVFRVPDDASWAGDSWAPMPIERDGKIFLYFGNNANGVGVASSATPTGEFKDAKGSALVTSSTPGASGTNSWLFDPGAFIDDDGKAYLSFGGNGVDNARIIALDSTLAGVTGSAAHLSPPGFFEASFLFKRNGIYYLAYSTDSANGLRIDYMTSQSPMSGYTYGGVVAGQPPVNNNNNHASEFEFNGRWYHAYHNRSVSTQAGISTTYRRNLALEVLDFNTDGSIKQVTYTTDGVPQLGHLDPYVRVEAETMNAQSGIETEVCSAGGMDVTNINDGDWIKVRGVDFGTAGATSFSARVAGTASGGHIELHLGTTTGTLAGTCSVPMTGGAQTWMTTTCDVSGATGVQDLVLVFKGTGSSLFNIDSWQFAGGDGGAGGSGGLGGNGGVAGMSTAGMAGSAQSSGGVPGGGGASGRPGAGGVGATGAASGSAGASAGTTTLGSGGAHGTATGGTAGVSGGSGNATGGSAGAAAGGVNATGGSSALGGSSATGHAGEPSTTPAASSSSGCGCTVADQSRGTGWLTAAVGFTAALGLRRRRPTRKPSLAARYTAAQAAVMEQKKHP